MLLYKVRQHGTVLYLGPTAAGGSDITLPVSSNSVIHHRIKYQLEGFDVPGSHEISANARSVGHLKTGCHSNFWL